MRVFAGRRPLSESFERETDEPRCVSTPQPTGECLGSAPANKSEPNFPSEPGPHGWLQRCRSAILYRLIRAQAGIGPVDAGTLGILVGSGILAPSELVHIGTCAGAKLMAAIHAAKGSVASTFALELAMAKTADYQISTRLRRSRSSARPFYEAMARAGLDAGWAREGSMLPWWYGAISYGGTGAIDFLIASALGAALREAFDQLIEPLRELGQVQSERVEEIGRAFFEQIISAVGEAISRSGAQIQSPITRHLAAAMRGEADKAQLSRIEARLRVNPRGAAIGTVAGHAISGATVGALLADPLLGAAIGAVDAVGDAMLTQAAMDGRFRTLTRMKAQLIRAGWSGQDGRAPAAMLSDFYAQIGGEVRLLGADLRALAEAIEDAATSSVHDLESWLPRELGFDLEAWSSVGRQTPSNLIRAAIRLAISKASTALEVHSRTSLSAALRADFPQIEKISRALGKELE